MDWQLFPKKHCKPGMHFQIRTHQSAKHRSAKQAPEPPPLTNAKAIQTNPPAQPKGQGRTLVEIS